jgi:hypothetical protein
MLYVLSKYHRPPETSFLVCRMGIGGPPHTHFRGRMSNRKVSLLHSDLEVFPRHTSHCVTSAENKAFYEAPLHLERSPSSNTRLTKPTHLSSITSPLCSPRHTVLSSVLQTQPSPKRAYSFMGCNVLPFHLQLCFNLPLNLSAKLFPQESLP